MKPRPAYFFILFLSFSISLHVPPIADAAVSVAKTITVDSKGGGDFTKVQAAIDSVPTNNNQWIRIHVKAGVYKEKVLIPPTTGFILLEGDGAETTSIEWGDYALDHGEGRSKAKTGDSATFTTSGNNMVFKGITFKNTFNGGNNIKQAVAALVYSDKASFHNCRFIGIQDTLADFSGRHYFKDSYIEGAIDFIFGGGQSIYEGCILSTVKSPAFPGHVTAHARNSESEPGGFVFKSCSVVGLQKTFLGRPWRPYSRVVFYKTSMSDVVVPEGWESWMFMGKESQITYAESSCTGPGANSTGRVKWLKKLDGATLAKFVDISFIDNEGWLDKQP